MLRWGGGEGVIAHHSSQQILNVAYAFNYQNFVFSNSETNYKLIFYSGQQDFIKMPNFYHVILFQYVDE